MFGDLKTHINKSIVQELELAVRPDQYDVSLVAFERLLYTDVVSRTLPWSYE